MNERIRELAEQATEEVMRNTPSFLVTNEMWKEKFAELIVGECCQAVWSEECNTSDLALEEYNRTARKIRQYLGVEE